MSVAERLQKYKEMEGKVQTLLNDIATREKSSLASLTTQLNGLSVVRGDIIQVI